MLKKPLFAVVALGCLGLVSFGVLAWQATIAPAAGTVALPVCIKRRDGRQVFLKPEGLDGTTVCSRTRLRRQRSSSSLSWLRSLGSRV